MMPKRPCIYAYNSDVVVVNVSGLVKLLLELGVLAVRPAVLLVMSRMTNGSDETY